MNQISWLLYLSDALPNTAMSFRVLTILLGILFVIFTAMSFAFYGNYSWNHGKEGQKLWPNIHKWNFLIAPAFIICLFGSNLIPSKSTILLIATSEFSQTYLTQSGANVEFQGLFKDTLQLLHNKVTEQLYPQAKK